MSFISRIKNYFYCKNTVLSKNQLKTDFGDYPPFPLNDAEIQFEFNKVEVRWFGVIYNTFNIGKKMVEASGSTIHLRPFRADGVSDDVLNQISESAKSLKELINSKQKFVLAFVLALVLPVVFIKFRKSIFFNSAGFYLPVIGSENQITVRISNEKNDLRIDSIISHEHIHFLQYMLNEYQGAKISDLDFLNSDLIKKDKYKPYAQFLVYAFERNEVEARLHEVVMSYYRANKELPLTLDGFINLLATSNEFGDLVVSAQNSTGKELKYRYDNFDVRDKNIAKQFKYILSAFSEEETRYKFITEVLTVMYGNLLMYYGDKNSSITFANQIRRPNMYDKIYYR